MSESDSFAIAIVDYGTSILAGKPATPLPPSGPTYTPALAQQQIGTPPLDNPSELKKWLDNALDGYPADEAKKWAQDMIASLPAAHQQSLADLIMLSVQDNLAAGSRRERQVHADLQIQHPSGSIQDEQYLRDSNGKIVIDPNTGTARRLDHIVIVNGKIVDVVETTSLTARKDQQLRHEDEVRQAGGTYIRDRNSGDLIEVPTISRIERRP